MANPLDYVQGLLSDAPTAVSNWWQDRANKANALGQALLGNTVPMRSYMNNITDADIKDALSGFSDGGMGGGLLAHTVWHGSPHKFDKFDMSKIGTGEGAQAYGHGLYFAEHPDVAKGYQETLSAKGSGVEGYMAKDALNGRSPEDAVKYIQSKYGGDGEISKAAINLIKNDGVNNGVLYKVDIPDEILPKMLDWDKPLSQQPEITKLMELSQDGRGVEALVNDATGSKMLWRLGQHDSVDSALNNITGSQLNALLKRTSSPSESSRVMSSAGIPGIRYLDGGSRGVGDGTSNYVLFNDQLPRILERNGVPTGNQPWSVTGLLGK